jgi:uncharacterized protein
VRWICCVALIVACSSGAKHEDSAQTMPEPAKPSAPMPRVTVGNATVDVEVVATEAKIEKGLMYRQHLPPDQGMLFLMGIEKEWSFWMRNTLIPLDMIFIRDNLTIAGIVENAEPKTETLRQVGEPSHYVLEVNGGWTKAHGVTKDQKVRFANVQ